MRGGLNMSELTQAKQLTHEEARAIIEPFYDLFRTDKRDWDKGLAVLDDNWKGYYTNNKFRNKTETRPFLKGLFDIVPDIDVEILALYLDGNTVSARCELSGTPVQDFMVPYSGRKFSIMTIDIHKIENGKIVELHHAEDWSTAIRQLQGTEE
jgi:predicted ester cyclase